LPAPTESIPDPPNWAVIASCIAAWIALAISALNAFYSARTFAINKAKEDRIKKKFSIRYESGHYLNEKDDPHRYYIFSVSIKNPSDSNISIENIRYLIKYKSGSTDQSITFDSYIYEESKDRFLQPPLKIEAKQIHSGNVRFRVPKEILSKISITQTTVIAIDSDGNISSFDPIILQDKTDAQNNT